MSGLCCAKYTAPCKEKLIFTTDKNVTGEEAMRKAATYNLSFTYGERNTPATAILTTTNSSLAINKKEYSPSRSSILGNNAFIFNYGAISTNAIKAKDHISLFCAENIPTGFNLMEKNALLPNLVGLGYSDIDEHSNFPSKSFFDQLIENQGFDNKFSLQLCGNYGPSEIMIGGVDPKIKDTLRDFIPIKEKSEFVVPALYIRTSNDKRILANFGTRTVIDTGTAFTVLPRKMAEIIRDEIISRAQELGIADEFPKDFFRLERVSTPKMVRFASLKQVRQFPTFEIAFSGLDGKKKYLLMQPMNYFKEMDPLDPNFRAFGFRETDGEARLGQSFLENYYIFVDRKNGIIGFGDIDKACNRPIS